jgi:cysteine desulfurase
VLPVEVVFTSGAPGVQPRDQGAAFALRERGTHIVTSKIEHHAVLHTCRWLERRLGSVTYVGVDADGRVDPSRCARRSGPRPCSF